MAAKHDRAGAGPCHRALYRRRRRHVLGRHGRGCGCGGFDVPEGYFRTMKLASFIAASLFPILFVVVFWFATKRWKPLYKTSLLILSSVLSLPLGWELVSRVLNLD